MATETAAPPRTSRPRRGAAAAPDGGARPSGLLRDPHDLADRLLRRTRGDGRGSTAWVCSTLLRNDDYLSLEHWRFFLTSDTYLGLFWKSVRMSLGVSITAVLLAYPIAYLLALIAGLGSTRCCS